MFYRILLICLILGTRKEAFVQPANEFQDGSSLQDPVKTLLSEVQKEENMDPDNTPLIKRKSLKLKSDYFPKMEKETTSRRHHGATFNHMDVIPLQNKTTTELSTTSEIISTEKAVVHEDTEKQKRYQMALAEIRKAFKLRHRHLYKDKN